jgi:hypothetical protein
MKLDAACAYHGIRIENRRKYLNRRSPARNPDASAVMRIMIDARYAAIDLIADKLPLLLPGMSSV